MGKLWKQTEIETKVNLQPGLKPNPLYVVSQVSYPQKSENKNLH